MTDASSFPPPSDSPPPSPGYSSPQLPRSAGASDDITWSVLSHLSSLVSLGIVGPLIVMLTVGKDRPYVRHHAVEALNFHITVAIALFASFVLMIVLIGFLLLPAVLIGSLVFSVLAAVAAGRGEAYRYPLCIRLVS
jgi:uncharacterized protein